MTATASVWLHGGAAAVCLVWTALVLGVGRGRQALAAALACGATALWTGLVALDPTAPLTGAAGAAEVLRTLAWGALLLLLCRRTGGPAALPLVRRFALAGIAAAALALLVLLPGAGGALALPSLGSPGLLARMGLALLLVLLAENLYRNADEAARWHVNLPAIALGGLAALDLLLYADAALSRAFSPALLDARAALATAAMPLLAIAAVRDRRLRRDPPVSRAVVFHGATLVVAGAFLLGVGAAGEALRQLDPGWGRTAQVSLLAGAAMALAVALSSSSARSRLRRLVVDHFFTARYDYRREWMRCVATLSAAGAAAGAGTAPPDGRPGPPAAARALRAIADPLDSPGGVLLRHEAGAFRGVGSWNLPEQPEAMLAGDHALVAALRDGGWIAELGGEAGTPPALRAAFGPLWLAVPLLHPREGLAGIALLAPPRAPFPLDGEVFDLLRTLGREVAVFLAERHAAERLADQRRLQDYAQRFAFVAHDVKTVASQLRLVLANAEHHIADPEFQQDMLLTVRASADRIDALIARLRQPGEVQPPDAAAAAAAAAEPLAARLGRLAAGRAHPVAVEEDPASPAGAAAMDAARLDAAVTHLLDNAIEASSPGEPVRVRLRQEGERILVDIIDRGTGMTPAFIRDELFRPLATSKPGGNGIGAWQARELLREAGGDLTVLSRPGAGTTMRLVLPAAPEPVAAAAPTPTPAPALGERRA